MWRRVNVKIQNSTNSGNNSYEIKPKKTFNMKDLIALSWR